MKRRVETKERVEKVKKQKEVYFFIIISILPHFLFHLLSNVKND